MKLHSLSVRNFRGITDQKVEFGDGLTIVSGRNEAGKSSLIDAFDLLIELKATSASRKVKSVKPVHDDVGPEVEAEFTIGPHRVRYSKRWLKSPVTELRFLEGPRSGQSETGDAGHEVARELWEGMDETLWQASRLMQAQEPGQDSLGSSTALQRALGEQSGSAPDDPRSTPLLERVSSEVGKYFTPQRGSYSTLVTKAEKRLVAAETAVEDARSKLAGLESDVRELANLTEDLDRLTEHVDRESNRLKTLEAKAELARQAQELLERTGQERDSHVKEYETREESLKVRSALKADLQAATEELDNLTATRIERQEALAPREAEIASVTKKLNEAKDAKKKLAEALALATLFERQKRTRDEIDRLSAILFDHDSLTEQISKLSAGLRPVEQETVDRATDLERRIDIAEAAMKAGAAQVTIESLSSSSKLLINGTEEELGSEPLSVPVLDEYSIELPDQLRVTITPPASSKTGTDEVATLRNELSELLEEAGFETVQLLRQAHSIHQESLASIERLKERRSDRRGGVSADELRDELSQKRSWLDSQSEAVEGNIDELSEQDAAAATAVESAEAVLRSHEQDAASLRDELSRLNGQIDSQESVKQRADKALSEARELSSDKEVEKAVSDAKKAVENAEKAFQEAQQKLDESGGAEILADFEHLSQHVTGLQVQVERYKSDIKVKTAVLESKNRTGIQSGLDEAESELDRANRESASLHARADGARLLEEVLIRHQTSIRAQYVAPFKDALDHLGRALYQDPTFEATLENDLTVSHRCKDGITVSFDNLSTGAKEQLAILIRLATASLVSPDDTVPVMFDDTLGYSDPRMLHRTVSLIGSTQTAGQVIIFTANDERFAGLPDAHRISI
ncbi:AAA family ATPase [Flaviflexus massiliensis]|uniref:AAA family ATPase n=1 Tax=Flaviflexus massiliensis TaxID=1522309 RepID=UPI0006D5AD88|nr:AAA family ATPase [Flaviflexus massiliensis]